LAAQVLAMDLIAAERERLARPALQCAGLIKRYGDVTAVDSLDLEVFVGECFGLLGPNGAGKTTTVEILEGLTESDSGTVTVFGCAWHTGRDRALRNRMGVQLQETQFADKVTVEETVRLFRSFYPNGSDVDGLIRTVELEEKRCAQYGKLSGGQKQRLALACALVNKPDLLFLDEPTTGLDPQARLKLWEIIEQFQAGGGTIILTTHYMEEAALLCDRVAIMDHGRVIALGTPDELIASLNADQMVEFSVRGELGERSLIDLSGVHSARRRNDDYLLSVSDIGVALPSLLAALEREHVNLVSLATHQPTLEDVFVSLTGRMLRDA